MSDAAVRLIGAGKRYPLFASKLDRVLTLTGAAALLPWRATSRELWALRDVDLTLARGQCLGVIGRNGAGKTTLLKLIAGVSLPTTGRVEVAGRVHTLMDAGAGFHPEFTGRENAQAALTLQGVSGRALDRAVDDIAEFAELSDWLDQPLRTYSLGMWARLAFATATFIKPDVLIVDEVLGAGDASFTGRSVERVRAMTGHGGAMIVVSHSMQQILQLCSEVLWLDDGRVVMSGRAIEVVKAYERRIREVEEERLRGRNAVAVSGEFGADSRWSGEGSLMITGITLGDGRVTKATFQPGEAMTLSIQFRATRSGVFPLRTAAVFYRLDGLRVIAPLDDERTLSLVEDETREIRLTFDRLNLGNGRYAISVSLFKEFDSVSAKSVAYDGIDRLIEFEVSGTPPALDAVFSHPVSWSVSEGTGRP